MISLLKEYIRSIALNSVGIFEFGIDGIRLDSLLINCHKQYIRGFEFKVSRNDFLNDKKWSNYLQYCNTFSFVCPMGLINKSELPQSIGLIYVEDKGYIYGHWIKRPTGRKVDKEIYIKILSLMLQKAKFRKEDIF